MNALLVEDCRHALQSGVGLLLQSSLLLVLGLAAGWLLRRRGPALRAFLCQMTLAGVALGAVLAVALAGRVQPMWAVRLPAPALGTSPALGTPPARLGSPPPRSGEETVTDVEAQRAGAAAGENGMSAGQVAKYPPRSGEVASLGEPEGFPAPQASPRPQASPYLLLASLWAAVSGLLLLWLGACQWHLTRLRQRAQPITEGRAAETLARLAAPLAVRPPRLLQSPHVRSPFLAGLRRPAIFLPSAWDADFDDATLRVVLAHELAHLTRRDCAWTLLLRLTGALLWPQPLLWLLARQLDQAAEEACDLMALAPDCPPRRYADCLLSLADRALPSPAARTLGAGVVPVRSSLGRRIQSVLNRRNHTMTPISSRLRLTLAAVTVSTVAAGTFLVSSAPAVVPKSSAGTSLVGMWLYQAQPICGNKTGIVIYKPDGKYEYIFAGDARHDQQQSYGTYVIDGDTLKGYMTSASFEDPNVFNHSRVLPVNTVADKFWFKVSGDTLTIRDATGEVSVASRIADGAEPALIRKWVGEDSVPQTDVQPRAPQPQPDMTPARTLKTHTPVKKSRGVRPQQTFRATISDLSLMALQRSRAEAQLQLQVARKRAETYDQLAKSAGPTTVTQLDTLSRQETKALQTQIAAAEAQIAVAEAKMKGLSKNGVSPLSPRQQEQAYLDVLKERRKALMRQPYSVAHRNSEYHALMAQSDAARAQVASARAALRDLCGQMSQAQSGARTPAVPDQAKAAPPVEMLIMTRGRPIMTRGRPIMTRGRPIITLKANKLDFVHQGQIHASGGVRVQDNGQNIISDSAVFDTAADSIEFFGHVRATTPDGSTIQAPALMVRFPRGSFRAPKPADVQHSAPPQPSALNGVRLKWSGTSPEGVRSE